jgi:ferrous iron transport protein A
MTNNYKGVILMPLTMAKAGENLLIKKILGRDETKKFLETLGFVIGGFVTVVSENNGNVIVMVKNSRVAIDKSMANRIMV